MIRKKWAQQESFLHVIAMNLKSRTNLPLCDRLNVQIVIDVKRFFLFLVVSLRWWWHDYTKITLRLCIRRLNEMWFDSNWHNSTYTCVHIAHTDWSHKRASHFVCPVVDLYFLGFISMYLLYIDWTPTLLSSADSAIFSSSFVHFVYFYLRLSNWFVFFPPLLTRQYQLRFRMY